MPNTFIGLIILIAFLVPGFLAIIVARRKVPLLAARQSQIEIVLWGCLFSLISHIIMAIAICIIILLGCIFSCEIRDVIYKLSNLRLFEISTKLDKIRIGHLLLSVFIYSIMDSILSFFLGLKFSKIIDKNPNLLPDLDSVWISVFSEKKAYFARALLDNGYYVVGTAKWIQSDPESLISGNRDILFIEPVIFNSEGIKEEQVAEGILINTRNIKILELSTAELDNEETDDYG